MLANDLSRDFTPRVKTRKKLRTKKTYLLWIWNINLDAEINTLPITNHIESFINVNCSVRIICRIYFVLFAGAL